VKIDTYTGDGPYRKFRDFQGTTVDVALSSRDRARPFPGADSGARNQSPSPAAPTQVDPAQLARLTALGKFLDDAMQGPGAPGRASSSTAMRSPTCR